MDKEIGTDVNNMGMSDLAKGSVRFSIRADDTPENLAVHKAFREFCKVETNNDYTQGLRKLLEYYQGDFKYELINDRITELNTTLLDLKGSIIEVTKKKDKDKPESDNDNGAF